MFQIKWQVIHKKICQYKDTKSTKNKGIRANTKHRSWPEMIKDRDKCKSTTENRMKGSERQLTNVTGDNYGGDIDVDVIR